MDQQSIHEFLHAVPYCACMWRTQPGRATACLPDPQCMPANRLARANAGPEMDLCACGQEKLKRLQRCYTCVLRERDARVQAAVVEAKTAVLS